MLNAHGPICLALGASNVVQEGAAVELGVDCLDLLRRVGKEDVDTSDR